MVTFRLIASLITKTGMVFSYYTFSENANKYIKSLKEAEVQLESGILS